MTLSAFPDAETVKQVAATSDDGVLASSAVGAVDKDIVMISDPFGVRAEAIRALRTHIVAQHLAEGKRALAVCAPSVGVGCSFVAANLAVALSQVGLNTLLIDANLREPSIGKFFPRQRPLVGLGQCLSEEAGQGGAFIEANLLDNLSIMFAGAPIANPQEVLGGTAFQTLTQSCLREFAITIVDTPPANRYADARRISSVIGYSLVVARRNVSLVEDVKTLIGELSVDHAHVVGSVLNEY
jgi:protein-tyrosine kinase